MSEDLIFHILEIEKTKDEALIKNAYRMKLASTNPEEKPEEFKRLRTAYEEALAYARKTDEDGEEDSIITAEELDSPAAQWMQKVSVVYNSIKRRLDENEWRELLNDDICTDLEYAQEIQKRLFSFLMENYQLTSRIYQMLNEIFSIEENQEELKEYLPEGFVDFMVGRIHDQNGDLEFAFEWLEGDEYADYDAFIHLQYKLEDQVFHKDFTAAKQTIEEMEVLNIYHPFFDLEKANIISQQGNYEEAAEIARRLILAYPDSLRIPSMGAEMIWKTGAHDEAAEIFASVEEKGEFPIVEKYLAYYAYEKGNREEAEDYTLKVLNQNYQEEEFFEFGKKLDKERIELAKAQKPQNADEAKRYVIACIHTEHDKEGLEFLKDSSFLEELIGGYGYLCHFYMKQENWEEVKRYAIVWRDLLAQREDEEGVNRMTAESWLYQAEAAYGMAKKPSQDEEKRNYWLREAEQALLCAIACGEEDMFIRLTTFLLDVQMEAEAYQAAKQTADKILAVYPNFFIVLSKKQKICYELREAQEVIDIFYQAQDIYLNFEDREVLEAYVAGFYELAAEVFMHYQQYEDSERILKQAEEAEVDSPTLKLYKVRLMRLKAWSDISIYHSDEEAAKILTEFLEQKVEDKILAELYYEMALIEDKQYYQPWVHPGKSKEYICKAIELYKDPSYHYVYGNILFQEKDYKEALKQYEETERIGGATENLYINMGKCYGELDVLERAIWYFIEAEKMDPENDRVNGYLGDVYTRLMQREQLREYGELAIKYTTRQIERNGDNAFEYMDRCQVYLDLNRYDEALEDADKALKLDKNNCFALSFKAKAYLGKKQYQKAVYFIKKAIAAMESPNQVLSFYQTAGDCCLRMGDFKQAESFYEQGLKIAKMRSAGMDDEYYSSLISLYKAAGDFDKAEKFVKLRYKQSRNGKASYGRHGRFELDLLRIDIARFDGNEKLVKPYITTAKRILSDYGENSQIMEELGDIYLFYAKNRRKALKFYEAAYVCAESEDSLEWNKDIVLNLMLLYKEGGDEKLLEKYRKIYINLLCKKFDTKDEGLAEKNYTEMLYDTMQNLFEMGKYWFCVGDLEKAKQYCEKMKDESLCQYCVKMGGCTDYYELKGMIYEAEQNLTEALKCYETAVQLDRLNRYSLWKVRLLKKQL